MVANNTHADNAGEYHGPDRRKPENEKLRLGVQMHLIAFERIQEKLAANPKKKSGSLLDW